MIPAARALFRSAVSLLLLAPLAAGCGGGGGGGEGGGDATPGEEGGPPPGEEGTYLHIVLPSVLEQGEECELKLRVVTQAGLPDYDFEGAFRIETPTTDVKFPQPPVMEPGKEGYYFMRGITMENPGVHFLRGVVPGDTVQALANPVNVVAEREYGIFWGDLNGHSDLSSGNRAPGVYFWYAKSVGLLDWVALTDNDSWEQQEKILDEETFLEIADVVDEHDDPGTFVTIPALEWTSAEYGNRIVLFPERPAGLPSVATGTDTPAKLREAVGGRALIAVAHPSGSAEANPADPARVGTGDEDLVEVYSSLGSFEMPGSHRASTRETPGSSVRDLLLAGFRPGFVAGGDGRLTAPGNPRPPAYGDHRYSGGLTAVLAEELTREAVLEALRARRCYATTGPRFLLEFTVDGEQMGSELEVASGHRAEVYGALGATTDWVRVEVVGPDGLVAELTPSADEASDVVEIRATTDPIEEATWVYLRGFNSTGNMAWSSPVWILPE
jgi:hypothetical protein